MGLYHWIESKGGFSPCNCVSLHYRLLQKGRSEMGGLRVLRLQCLLSGGRLRNVNEERVLDMNGISLSIPVIFTILTELARGGSVTVKNVGHSEFATENIVHAKNLLSVINGLRMNP